MSHHWGYVAVLFSAFLFGVWTTINKILLQSTSPLLIAAITYLSAGLVLACSNLFPTNARITSLFKLPPRTKTRLVWKDTVLILLIAFSGGVLGPYLFLVGLNKTTAVSTALLANTETLFTIGIAFIFLGERGRLKDYAAMTLLILGAVTLTTNLNFQTSVAQGTLLGNVLVVGGCLFWGIDNSLSRLLSVKRSLLQLGSLKGVIGGSLLLGIASLHGSQVIPTPVSIAYLVIVGVFCVGLSLLLFLFSLQEVGAMRTSVIFSTSSLFGVVSAFLILRESITFVQVAAGVMMLFAIYVLSIPPKRKELL